MILKKNIAVVAESHDSLAKLPFGNQDLAMVSQESETMGLLSSPRLEESVRDHPETPDETGSHADPGLSPTQDPTQKILLILDDSRHRAFSIKHGIPTPKVP